MVKDWEKAQKWEKDWHGDCVNSFYEEEKQLVYAEKMGLVRNATHKTPYNFDLKGLSVIDVGAGPYSLLLKCVNFKRAIALDPIKYPEWVYQRYKISGIEYQLGEGERLNKYMNFCFDEAWIYNVLQHTDNPKKIIENMRKITKIIRIFEWIDCGTNEGHIHNLTKKKLDSWLGGDGKTERVKSGTANPMAYFGVFKGDHYAV